MKNDLIMKKNSFLILVILFITGCKSAKSITNTTTMDIRSLHAVEKDVSTNLLFSTQENKVVALQILKGKQLKEHITKVPALLVCVTGEAIYADEKGQSFNLKSGSYVTIEPNVKHWVDAVETSNLLLIK